MAYGSNLLTNSSAELGDTSGWNTSGTISIEENQALESSSYQFDVDNHEYWTNYKHIHYIEGGLGTYHYTIGESSYMEQTLTASGGDLTASSATDYKIEIAYKLPTAQDPWDSSVLARATGYLYYDNDTMDMWSIPLVKGVTYSNHNLTNFWIYLEGTLEVDATKTIESLKIKIQSDTNLTGGLHVDYINLRENTE